jgi:hypothetical protein
MDSPPERRKCRELKRRKIQGRPPKLSEKELKELFGINYPDGQIRRILVIISTIFGKAHG